jgi:hypothetical protein
LQRGLFHFSPDWHTAATFADQRGAAMMARAELCDRLFSIQWVYFNGRSF